MKLSEAKAEARRRWGSVGYARVDYDGRGVSRRVVGTIGALPGQTAYGTGDSWEIAFADAERRASK
jgi:hypothetical protein